MNPSIYRLRMRRTERFDELIGRELRSEISRDEEEHCGEGAGGD